MFNVVHLATMLKVDIYVLTSRSFDREWSNERGPPHRACRTHRHHPV